MCEDLIEYYDFCVFVKPVFNEIKEVFEIIDDKYFNFNKIKDKGKFFSKVYRYLSKRRYTREETDNFCMDINRLPRSKIQLSFYESRYVYIIHLARSPLFRKFFDRIVNAENMEKEIKEIKIFMRNKYILFLLSKR